jgi:hypothetical protein
LAILFLKQIIHRIIVEECASEDLSKLKAELLTKATKNEK